MIELDGILALIVGMVVLIVRGATTIQTKRIVRKPDFIILLTLISKTFTALDSYAQNLTLEIIFDT